MAIKIDDGAVAVVAIAMQRYRHCADFGWQGQAVSVSRTKRLEPNGHGGDNAVDGYVAAHSLLN